MHYLIDDKNHWITLSTDSEWEQGVLWFWINEYPRPSGIESWNWTEDAILRQFNTPDKSFWRVRPEENGDLTDGCIFTDGIYEWWDEGYAIRSFVDKLADDGEAEIKFARSHTYPRTIREAIEYLNHESHKITVHAFGGKAYYTFVLSNFLKDDEHFTLWDADRDDLCVDRFFDNLEDRQVSYRLMNPIVLGKPIEFFDTQIEAPYDASVEPPLYDNKTWDNDKWLEAAKELWFIEQSIGEELRTMIADLAFLAEEEAQEYSVDEIVE